MDPPKNSNDDEEEDYMSMTFDEPSQPIKETSLQRRLRLKREVCKTPFPQTIIVGSDDSLTLTLTLDLG
jgi:hypothetical protein